MAYSWAYDKFKQALDRVHRMNSVKPVNVYVVLCTGTIDRRLESLVQEKSDAAELVLDGRLIGERTEEVNLAELLKVARREFNDQDSTLDEGLLQAQWPQLRQRLSTAMNNWIDVPVEVVSRPSINHQLPNYQLPNMSPIATARSVPQFITLRPPVMLPTSLRAQPLTVTVVSGDRHDPLAALSLPVMGNPITAPPRAQVQVQVQASAPAPATAPPAAPAPTTPAEPLWKSRCRARFQVKTSDVWSSL